MNELLEGGDRREKVNYDRVRHQTYYQVNIFR